MQTVQFITILSPEQLIERGLLKGLNRHMLERMLPSVRQRTNQGVPEIPAQEANRQLIEYASELVMSPEWKGVPENSTEEFLAWRNRI